MPQIAGAGTLEGNTMMVSEPFSAKKIRQKQFQVS